ncbi:copper homeostasis protein CutC [Mariniluteicoccus endophyticus]
MSGLLEVIALHADDARRAEEGGADRVEVVGTIDHDGMSPTPDVVKAVRAATSIEVRVTLRLREGFGTDGGEFVRLHGLAASYVDAGADGIVLGFLNGHGEVDLEVCNALLDEGDWPFTFHRAIDSAFDTDKAWRAVRTLPRLDQVLTAGSARDVEHGLDDLLSRAKASPEEAALMMVGGGLQPEHVAWLARAGVRAFHIGAAARPQGSFKAWVDADLVASWRSLIDSVTRGHA